MVAVAVPVLCVLAAMVLVMALSWVFQRAAGNAGWTDVFWTLGTGVCLAVVAVTTRTNWRWRAILTAVLVTVWSVRLGSYVAGRVAGASEDARYAGFRRKWGSAFQRNMIGLSLIQAPASGVLAVSVVLAAGAPGASMRLGDVVGTLILIVAVAGEALADEQMKRFKANSNRRGAVCDQGLWAWSRHPNYFFEWIGWFAYPAIAIRASEPWTFASLAAPALMLLLLRFGSGIPPLEQVMLESRGDAYRRYQARVSPLIPLPPRGPGHERHRRHHQGV